MRTICFIVVSLLAYWWACRRASELENTSVAGAGHGGDFPSLLLEGGATTEEELISLAERHGQGLLAIESLLPTLSPDTARKLLEQRQWGSIDLPRLTTLSVETAAVLGEHHGPLQLDGLVELPTDCARQLARIAAPLILNGVRTLSAEAAAALSLHHGWLSLDGLKSLPTDVASHLAQHRHIVHLGEFYNRLSLNGVENISEEAAAALAHFLGNLRLNGLTSLTPEVARCLAEHAADGHWGVAETYSLMLDGLVGLSDEAASALAKYRGGLSLDGIESLSPSALFALARHPGNALSLGRLRSMPDDVAVLLGERPKWLHLPSLRGLSPAALAAIHRNPHVTLPDEGNDACNFAN